VEAIRLACGEVSRRCGFLLQIPLQMQQNAEPAVASAATAPPVNALQLQAEGAE